MENREVILVVEDEPLVRDSIALELEDAGFDVVIADNGDEASFILPKMRRIDLLLTDIRMPGRINGWVLGDMARCRRPTLPIIYTSAFATQQEATNVEGSLFLEKPYRIGQILSGFEELKSRSDEMASVKEEAELTNANLETSIEMLQSLKEKLQSANAKLRSSINELSRANSDIANFLEGAQVPTIVLDRDLAVRRFNTAAKNLFYLVQSDVGRPISRIHSRVSLNSVHVEAKRVLQTLSPIEAQLECHGGLKRYVMRILPYSTPEHAIAGVTVHFIDA